MLRLFLSKRNLFFLSAVLLPGLLLGFSVAPCFGAALQEKKSFPLIIMGGRWSPNQKPEYSNLSRVCDKGFTDVFSYYSIGSLQSDILPEKAINNMKEFAATIKTNCPKLGLVVGIPSRWIIEGRIDLIQKYILGLKADNIQVDYWLADEMINTMVTEGLPLKDAERLARQAIDAAQKTSSAPYIWIEPGNYNARLSSILDAEAQSPAGVKSYDEYIVSRKGRLANAPDAFQSLLNTLKKLKANGNIVYPVCEINREKLKNIEPLPDELATIAISLYMEGADGLVFYEERWTTPEILENLKKIFTVINFLNEVQAANFVKEKNQSAFWQAKNNNRTISVLINTTRSDMDLTGIIPNRSVILWPPAGKIKHLHPLETLVFYSE